MTRIFHFTKNKEVNVPLWLSEAYDAAKDANGVITLAFHGDELRISYCNLNEIQLTWAAAKLNDYVEDLRRGDD